MMHPELYWVGGGGVEAVDKYFSMHTVQTSPTFVEYLILQVNFKTGKTSVKVIRHDREFLSS